MVRKKDSISTSGPRVSVASRGTSILLVSHIAIVAVANETFALPRSNEVLPSAPLSVGVDRVWCTRTMQRPGDREAPATGDQKARHSRCWSPQERIAMPGTR